MKTHSNDQVLSATKRLLESSGSNSKQAQTILETRLFDVMMNNHIRDIKFETFSRDLLKVKE